ncbi:Nuclear-interacting partner of ALK [Sesamum alatum]|uniref:Nuclear-interacting partner of ALK n=1 Tax=Sesamum alatum TaxID=300844 RepID=A0AAE1YVR1_9LAMI|nr:Nuclear-interacting partner of ALK [Sesamum alatum]
MAEESEKRFEAIMNKLFHVHPKSKTNSNNTRHGVQTLSGRKRPHSSLAGTKLAGNVDAGISLSVSGTSTLAPACRPWDRDDLFRRLSTFKSMTWFAKPQVVSPLECARRGWVNVDMDTIACASCDARLLFSTPSAWTQQQVEKAAMVFSLKLESGHKLLCPWINNGCMEEIAQFPIVSRADLIEDYKKRLFSLSQLIALPVILPVAIDNIMSAQLEQFLKQSSTSGYKSPLEKSRTELSGDVPESISSISYYQAQKLISLFGWEPHVLPYKVDLKDGENQSVKDANVMVTTGQKHKVSIYHLSTGEDMKASAELQFDPSSVVLDCNLCGASVGLWAFSTISRPLEYLRFVGLTEVNGRNISTDDEVCAQEGSSGNQIHTGSREGITNAVTTASTSLGFTIAGGPPPAMLNYGATISLPIIGHSLRTRFSTETETKDHLAVQKLSQVEDQQMSLESENVTAEGTVANPGPDFIAKNPVEDPQTVPEGSMSNVNLIENLRTTTSAVADHHRFDAENNVLSRKDGRNEPNRKEMDEAGNCEQGSSYPSNHPDNPEIGSFAKCTPVPFSPREDKNLPSLNKSKEFDPIKQHRFFCPWIMSTDKFVSGWKQTLSALEGHKELNNVPSSNLIEVDDPVSSVKKLFTSPNDKRTKVAGGS